MARVTTHPEKSRRSGERLLLSTEVMEDLSGRAAAGYPYEVCGLLLGSREDQGWRVRLVTEGKNLAEDRKSDRYLLDPTHYLEADRLGGQHGVDIIGSWHTHPDHPAVPSITDLENAWPSFLYLIVPTQREGAGTGRTWLLDEELFLEIDMEIKA